jgi:alpha-galactosidase
MPDARHARVAVRSTRERTLEPGESFHTFRTFVSVHQGDYFRTLTEYRRLMVRQGFQMASAPDSTFGPIWCAWGYGRSVALVEFCPCGTAYSFFTMPHFNMSVASDPESSFQIRSKGKTLKALMGDSVPYFGDHVELSDEAIDFASTVGVGGVVGTQFVLPNLVKKHGKSDLTAQRQKIFEKWLHIFNGKMLSRGEYLGDLYDIGFDLPEAHVIRKEQELYYAFFARHWSGPIELRGLQDRAYRIVDYVNNKDLGRVHGPKATLSAEFDKHLLLDARPE